MLFGTLPQCHLMSRVLPAETSWVSASLDGRPATSSFYHCIYRHRGAKQPHPVIHNPNSFPLRTSNQIDITNNLMLQVNRCDVTDRQNRKSSPEILTRPVMRSPGLSMVPIRDICPLPCVTKRTPPKPWWSSSLILKPRPSSLHRSRVVRA